MNKTNIMKKTLIAGLACVALCGTTFAAPHGGGKAPQKAPARQQAPAHHAPAPAHHRTPAPPPPRHHHHGGHHGEAGWIALGAAAIGGIVGGILTGGR